MHSINNPVSRIHSEALEASNTRKPIAFPSYLLQDVFVYLNVFDLLTCRRVCHTWNAVVQSRRLLRQRLFLSQDESDSPGTLVEKPSNKEVFELHPIFSLLHFDPSLRADKTTFGRKKTAYLKDSSVRYNYATSPKAPRVSLEVLKFHPHCVVENPTGVTVWDVVEQLVKYKAQPAKLTFQAYFGSKICNKRGYDRVEQMARRDLLGQESVFITFNTRDPEDNLLFIADSFESRSGPRKGKIFRFWSAFAFCDDSEA